MDKEEKEKLATLQLEGTTLIWWGSNNQEYLIKKGKMITSQYELRVALKNQFYP